MNKEQKILLITTGGTISQATDEKGAHVSGTGSASGTDLLSSVQGKNRGQETSN